MHGSDHCRRCCRIYRVMLCVCCAGSKNRRGGRPALIGLQRVSTRFFQQCAATGDWPKTGLSARLILACSQDWCRHLPSGYGREARWVGSAETQSTKALSTTNSAGRLFAPSFIPAFSNKAFTSFSISIDPQIMPRSVSGFSGGKPRCSKSEPSSI